MRPLWQPITATTDANGAATIKIPIPQTGEWHDVKFALQTSAAAEWAILVAGSPVTFGRGRRVTLGPELLQDGETVTVSVTGGPPTAVVSGSMNGKSGTPAEILAGYTPQPNTIALDAAATHPPLLTLTAGTKTVPVLAGTIAVAWAMTNAGGINTGTLEVSGVQSGIIYEFASLSGPSGTVDSMGSSDAFLLDPDDTSLTVVVTATLGNPQVALWSLGVPASMYVRPSLDTIFSVKAANAPAPWQVPNVDGAVGIGTVAMSTVTTVIAAGLAGTSTRLFKFVFGRAGPTGNVTLESPSGTTRANVDGARSGEFMGDWGGETMGSVAAVIYRTGGASVAVSGGYATANQS